MKFQRKTPEGDSDHPGKEIQKKIQEAGLLLVLKILGVQIFWILMNLREQVLHKHTTS